MVQPALPPPPPTGQWNPLGAAGKANSLDSGGDDVSLNGGQIRLQQVAPSPGAPTTELQLVTPSGTYPLSGTSAATGGITVFDVRPFVQPAVDGVDFDGNPNVWPALSRAYTQKIKPIGGGILGIGPAPGTATGRWSAKAGVTLPMGADGVTYLEIQGDGQGSVIAPDASGGLQTLLVASAAAGGGQFLMLKNIAFVGRSTNGQTSDVTTLLQTTSDMKVGIIGGGCFGFQAASHLFNAGIAGAFAVQDYDLSGCNVQGNDFFRISGGLWGWGFERVRFQLLAGAFANLNKSGAGSGADNYIHVLGDNPASDASKGKIRQVVFGNSPSSNVNGICVFIDPPAGSICSSVIIEESWFQGNCGIPVIAHDCETFICRDGTQMNPNAGSHGTLLMQFTNPGGGQGPVQRIIIQDTDLLSAFTLADIAGTSNTQVRRCTGLGSSTLKTRAGVSFVNLEDNDARIGTLDFSVAAPQRLRERFGPQTATYLTDSGAGVTAAQLAVVAGAGGGTTTAPTAKTAPTTAKGQNIIGVVGATIAANGQIPVLDLNQHGLTVLNDAAGALAVGDLIAPSGTVAGKVVGTNATPTNACGISEAAIAASSSGQSMIY